MQGDVEGKWIRIDVEVEEFPLKMTMENQLRILHEDPIENGEEATGIEK